MGDTPTLLKARVQRLHSERARKLERLRRVEWQFDKDPNVDMLTTLSELRAGITELERNIAATHALVKMAEVAYGTTTVVESHNVG